MSDPRDFSMSFGDPFTPHAEHCGALENGGDHLMFTWCTLDRGHDGDHATDFCGSRRTWPVTQGYRWVPSVPEWERVA
jgi:hypothetical protein